MAFEKKLRRGSGDFPELGAIFMSNRATKKMCFSCETFGLPYSKSSFVKQVKAGMFLFLFEHETRSLYGVYQACTDGTVNFTSNAFSSAGRKYPAQVKFRVIWYCEPLSEDEFRPAIEDNYFAPYKFNFGLSRSQVWKLLTLFSSRKLGDISQQLDILPNPIIDDAGELNANSPNQNRDLEKFSMPIGKLHDEGYDPDAPLLNDNISINCEQLNIKPVSENKLSPSDIGTKIDGDPTQKRSVFSRLKPALDADEDEGNLEDSQKSIDDLVNEVMETLKGHYCQLVSESNLAIDQVSDDDDNKSKFKKSPSVDLSVEYEALIENPRLSFKRRSEVHKASSAAAGEKQCKRRTLMRPRSDKTHDKEQNPLEATAFVADNAVDEESIDCSLKLNFTMLSGDKKPENTVCCDLNGEVKSDEIGDLGVSTEMELGRAQYLYVAEVPDKVHEEEKSTDLLAEAIPASCQGTDVRYFEFLTK